MGGLLANITVTIFNPFFDKMLKISSGIYLFVHNNFSSKMLSFDCNSSPVDIKILTKSTNREM